MKNLNFQKRKGFTLTETVIALGIVSILLTSFLAVFGPATQNIRKAITTQESGRILSALEAYLKNGVSTQANTTSFEEVISILEKSQNGVGNDGEYSDTTNVRDGLLFYNYRVKLNDANSEAEAATNNDSRAGIDYTTISAVRKLSDLNDPSLDMQDEIAAIEGRLFYVRLQQLITDTKDGALILKPRESSSLQLDSEGDVNIEPNVHIKAQVYVVPTVDQNYLDRLRSTGELKDLGEPLLSRNLTINR